MKASASRSIGGKRRLGRRHGPGAEARGCCVAPPTRAMNLADDVAFFVRHGVSPMGLSERPESRGMWRRSGFGSMVIGRNFRTRPPRHFIPDACAPRRRIIPAQVDVSGLHQARRTGSRSDRALRPGGPAGPHGSRPGRASASDGHDSMGSAAYRRRLVSRIIKGGCKGPVLRGFGLKSRIQLDDREPLRLALFRDRASDISGAAMVSRMAMSW